MEYAEAVHLQDIDQLKCMPLQYKLKRLMQSGFFPNVSVAFAEIFTVKPHSADIERLISVSIALKSTGRARMLLETENLNLYVHYNMPTVEEWDPRPAVEIWIAFRSSVTEVGPKDESKHTLKGYFYNPIKKVSTRISPQENEKNRFDFVNILVLLTELILS